MARQGITPQAKRRAERLAAYAEMKRRRYRYFIQLSVKGSRIPGTSQYQRYAWPKLFHTEEEAWAFAALNNPFKNSAATAGRGRIKSYSIQLKILPEASHA